MLTQIGARFKYLDTFQRSFKCFTGRVEKTKEYLMFLTCLSFLISDSISVPDYCISYVYTISSDQKKCDENAFLQRHINLLVRACITTSRFDLLYNTVYPCLEKDALSKGVFFECLDEVVLDGLLDSPPPTLVR